MASPRDRVQETGWLHTEDCLNSAKGMWRRVAYETGADTHQSSASSNYRGSRERDRERQKEGSCEHRASSIHSGGGSTFLTSSTVGSGRRSSVQGQPTKMQISRLEIIPLWDFKPCGGDLKEKATKPPALNFHDLERVILLDFVLLGVPHRSYNS